MTAGSDTFAAGTADRILRAECVGKTFWRNRVLSSASLRLAPGRITALLGRNGSGKTTLFRIASGLLRFDYGFVEFRGRRYRHPRLAALAPRGLFFLPERDFLPDRWELRTALRSMERRFRRRDEGSDLAGAGLKTMEALDALGLSALAETRTDHLSDGEARLAALAAALSRGPRCLLADEPLRELSPASAARASAALRRLADAGVAVAVTGHERREVLEMADRIVWMIAGTTHDLGPPRQAVRHPQFRHEYLGPADLPDLEA